jgi:Protein of unknown function (DUF664)
MTSPDRTSDQPIRRWTRSTIYADMWVDPDDDPRENGAVVGVDERSTLLGYLRRYRAHAADEVRGAGCRAARPTVDTTEEYARHRGHADLLRERIDGRIGQ